MKRVRFLKAGTIEGKTVAAAARKVYGRKVDVKRNPNPSSAEWGMVISPAGEPHEFHVHDNVISVEEFDAGDADGLEEVRDLGGRIKIAKEVLRGLEDEMKELLTSSEMEEFTDYALAKASGYLAPRVHRIREGK
ncbi:hypothetical protein CIP107572_00766 [Corynebacterium diphtheriae]|nr:hypothetical protein CIP107572_00766 [Corynebacterium diphtheriae]